ncbi:hypothetical protein Aduo_015991 [Ancylostoma duodenale]
MNIQNNNVLDGNIEQTSIQEKVVANTADLSTVMVWDGLTSNGKILLVFVDTGVKINKDIYPKSFLDTVLKPVVHILIWV